MGAAFHALFGIHARPHFNHAGTAPSSILTNSSKEWHAYSKE